MTRPNLSGLSSSSRAAASSLLLGVLAASLLAGCDNPACLFGSQGPDGCLSGGGSGGSSLTSATFPAQGEWIVAGAPRVEEFFPKGVVNAGTPVVVVFSESISPASINGAFELNPIGGGLGGGDLGGGDLGGNTLEGTLVGDGRVLVLFPGALIADTEYELVWASGSSIRDLTGSLALRPSDGVVGSFKVDADPGVAPELVMTWPLDGATGQSPLTEVVTIFDRVIDPTSVLPSSWRVLVDGLAPTHNPLPVMLSFTSTGLGPPITTPESRVWTWRSVDPATELFASLGVGMAVTVELSPNDGTPIRTEDGEAMDEASVRFTTQLFEPPVGAQIVSEPTDAIGLDNLNGLMPLMIQVEFTGQVLTGDVLEIWEFGTEPGTGGVNPDEPDGPPLPPSVLSLVRTFNLDEGTAAVVLGEAELQLLASTTPLTPHFVDGDLGFAFSILRGGESSPVRVLDVDASTAGIQDPLLDTLAPVFVGLPGLLPGDIDYRTDLRNLVVVGQGDEPLSSVEVIATLSAGTVDNRIGSQLPPLPTLTATGDFIAAPVYLDAIAASELPVDFSVILYDRALNASAPFFARWTQLGSSGPATALPGTGLDVSVTVYDAVTLTPISGATVYSHEVVAGALTAFAPTPVTTDAAGVALIASAPTGDTIITVEAAAYDLFSFHDVKTTRLDVPLISAVPTAAVVIPSVLGTGEDLNSSFLTTWIGDSRVMLPGDVLHAGGAPNYNPLTDQTVVPFTPDVINGGQLGVLSFLATKQPADQADPNAFSAASFLQAFETSFLRPKTEAGGLDELVLTVDSLLSAPGVDPEDVPLGVPNHVIQKSVDFALYFSNLVDPPSVSVEVLVGGVPGAMTVGMGKSYLNVSNDNYDLRAAYSALARSTGPYVEDDLIRDERYLRAEFVDISGARTGARVPLSTSSGSLQPLPMPILTSPVGSVTGTSYPLVYANVIRGSLDGKGLIRLSVTDSVGRTWQIWQPDQVGGSPTTTAFLPPIAAAGGSPLADGPVTCLISAWAWPGYDPTAFMYSDVAREHNQFLTTAPMAWDQQP